MKAKNILITLIFIGSLLLSGLLMFSSWGSDKKEAGSLQNTGRTQNLQKAPEFSLKDYNGKKVSLSNFVGRPVIVNSWAVWCPFCIEELDDFARVHRDFYRQLTIIAIDRAESRSTTKKFTDELGITDDLIFLLDPSDSFYQLIGGFSMPETIFINSTGEIVFHKRGPMEEKEIRQKISEFFDL